MTWSRRRVLQGAGASLTWAATGCGTKPASPPRLAFVGQDPERGHILREASRRDLPPRERIKTRVAVIGAGVAGLCAAWTMVRRGFEDFRLFELEDTFGGTARAGQMARSAYPMGAHYLPAPPARFTALVELLGDLGLVVGRDPAGGIEYDPRAICRAPMERHLAGRLWSEGLYPSAGQSEDEAAQWSRFQSLLAQLDGRVGGDGRRLFDLPVSHSSTDLRHLDRVSMAQWLDRGGFTSPRIRWLLDYGCRDDYGCTLAQTSAFAGLHHLLGRGLENGRDRPLLTWAGGNHELCTRLAERVGLADRLHSQVAVLAADPDTGELQAWDFEADRPLAIEAEVVLWAAPRFILHAVLPPGRDPLAADAFTYSPWLVANVQVAQAPAGVGAPLSWDNVQVGADHLGYVVANHLEPLDRRPEPGAVLTFYEPRPADNGAALSTRRRELLGASLSDLAAHVTAQLDGMHPGLARDITEIHIARWGHAMVRPVPGALFGGSLVLAAAPVGRVLPCAADVGGLPLFEEAFAQGVRGATEALERVG